jgi:hypothetical protein
MEMDDGHWLHGFPILPAPTSEASQVAWFGTHCFLAAELAPVHLVFRPLILAFHRLHGKVAGTGMARSKNGENVD